MTSSRPNQASACKPETIAGIEACLQRRIANTQSAAQLTKLVQAERGKHVLQHKAVQEQPEACQDSSCTAE